MWFLKKIKRKLKKSHRCCGKVPWLLGGGTTTTTMAIWERDNNYHGYCGQCING
jgi:hypothetical protein